MKKKDCVVIQNLAAIHGARLESAGYRSLSTFTGAYVSADVVTTLLHRHGEREGAPERDELEVYMEEKLISRQNACGKETKLN